MAIGSVLVHYSTEEVPVASLESVEDQPTFTREPRLGQEAASEERGHQVGCRGDELVKVLVWQKRS